jgi:hypothetical protein
MLNLRHLTRASPNDANLRTGIDPLGMLRQGGYDMNRNQYFHNTHKRLSNRTDDIFNHIREPNGGYNGAGFRLNDVLTPNRKGGILPLDLPNGIQPMRNALTNPLVIPKVSALIDFQPVPSNELVAKLPPPALRN